LVWIFTKKINFLWKAGLFLYYKKLRRINDCLVRLRDSDKYLSLASNGTGYPFGHPVPRSTAYGGSLCLLGTPQTPSSTTLYLFMANLQ